MPTLNEVHNTGGAYEVKFEIDITTAGAISATRGRGLSVSRTGTGTYKATITNRDFYEVLCRQCEYNQATPTAAWAGITAIDLNGAGDGTGATIEFKTFDDNATPAAADQATGTVSVCVTFGTSNQAA